jgi:hypothetical protein
MTSGEPLDRVSSHTFGPMPGLDVAHFANPYLLCDECLQRAEGFTWYTHKLIPCGHVAATIDTCPTWSPVDGCTCASHVARHFTPS